MDIQTLSLTHSRILDRRIWVDRECIHFIRAGTWDPRTVVCCVSSRAAHCLCQCFLL